MAPVFCMDSSANMELLLLPWLIMVIATLAALILFSYVYSRTKKPGTMRNQPPEAAGGWPLIGHLFLLSGPEPLHITLSEMVEKYGPVFSIRLGTRRGLIVNTAEAAKEIYRTNDVAFSNRPQTASVGLMGYNFAMLGFSNYGPYWREMRKISVLRLLSNRKVAALGDMRELEVKRLMISLYERCNDGVMDMKKVFGDFTLSLMARTVAGDVEEKMGVTERERWRRSIRYFFRMMTVFSVSDALPMLKWVDQHLLGTHRAFKATGKSFDAMLQGWLEAHKARKTSSCEDNKEEEEEEEEEADFMGEMLSLADAVSQEFPVYDADTINKATCQTMMIGGSETMAATLTWAVSLLLNNPQALLRAKEELDIHIGQKRLVKESDIGKLVYIQAIIKETFRLQPSVPVVPREAGKDCIVAGYHVPAGTCIFVNTWNIQRDPHVWPDPLEFKPERFLTSHKEVDVQGLHFELLPFGGGRRVCPAVSFALRATQFVLASFLQGFDIETPSGEPVDLIGSFGTTNMVTALEVCIRPRLSHELYA